MGGRGEVRPVTSLVSSISGWRVLKGRRVMTRVRSRVIGLGS